MKSRKTIAAGTLVALALAACTTVNTGDDGSGDTVDGGRMAPVSIDQVLTLEGETPVFVKGTLYSDADGVRLCEAIGESLPVQCLGDQLTVTDIDRFPEYAELLVGDGEVKTSEGEVNVVGFYSNGTLRVDPAAASADAS